MSQSAVKYPGRNLHHMTPRSRGGTREHKNMLLIHIDRHEAWHKLFGTKTLREAIRLLERLERLKRRQK